MVGNALLGSKPSRHTDVKKPLTGVAMSVVSLLLGELLAGVDF